MCTYGFTSLTTVPFESEVWVTPDLVGRDPLRGVLHKAMNVVVGISQKCDLDSFFVKTRELAEWKCLTILLS